MEVSKKYIFCIFLFIGLFITFFLSRFILQAKVGFQLISDGNYHIYSKSSFPNMIPNSSLVRVDSISKNALLLISFYNNFSNISNISNCASNLSSWKLFGNKSKYNLGETIQVSINLNDGYGKKLTTGGDFLRIWGVSSSVKANTAGYVVDHRNGSYTGFVKAVWRGNMEIRLMLAITKEHIGVFLSKIEKYGISVPIMASFARNTYGEEITEATRCSTIPNIKGSNHICNFTELNYNMSWYCGKPSKDSLRCEDWKFCYKKPPEIFTKLELELMQQHKYMRFRNPITVTVDGDTEKLHEQKQLCTSRPFKDTWNDILPTGYLFKNKWYDLSCTSTLQRTKDAYVKCLSNRNIHFFGDSTSRAWFSHLKSFLNMQMIHGHWNKERLKGRHKFTKAGRRDHNISMTWAPHEFPFYGSHSSTFNFRSVGSYIDSILQKSHVIIVLHWYIHLGRASHSIYRQHIQNARDAVRRLLNRSPDAKIFIKGPHSYQYMYHVEPHDYVKMYQQQILFEEFRQFQDKIVYLDQWDITVSNENKDVHTEIFVDREMVHNLLSHICPEHTT